jgi:predicted MFS family arabinose efflux permease
VALPLLAVDDLGASATDMAIMRSVRLLPSLLFGLAIAAWLDRRRRREVLIAIDLVQAALLGAVLLAALRGWLSMPLLWGFAALTGVLALSFGVARQAYVPSIVDERRLVRANSQISAGEAAAEAGAFALGGWLVQWIGAPLTLALDGLSFLGSALCLGAIRAREPLPDVEPAHAQAGVAAGLRTIAGDPRLRALALATLLIAFANELVGVVYMLFVRRELGFEPGPLGMLFMLGSIAAFFSSVVAERLGVALGPIKACAAGCCAAAVALAVFALAPGANLLGAGALAFQQLIGDFGLVVVQIHSLSLVQRIAPREQLARVTGAIAFGSSWAMLAGATLGGVTGEWLGSRATVLIAAATLLLAAILVARARPRSAAA